MAYVGNLAKDSNVDLNINTERMEMSMEGLKKDVATLKSTVDDILKRLADGEYLL